MWVARAGRGTHPASRFRPARFLLAWCALLLAIIPARVALASQAPETTPPIKHIVFLFSDEPTIPGNVRTDRGLRAGFARDPSFRTQYYHEYLDLTRFGGEAYEQRLAGILSQKYGNRQPDLLILIAPPATLFAARWALIIFPGVPVVYVCPSRTTVSALGPGLSATGVLGAFDVRGTMQAALRLRPQTRRVVVVSGAAVTDHEYLELMRADLTGIEPQVSVEYLVGLPMSELLDRVARLPHDAVILYLSIFRDGTGQDFQPPHALEQVAARSAVPVFSVSVTYLGRGIVGGRLFDWEQAGARAAGLALQVLHGASVRDLPPSSEGLSSWMFDARQLKRWGIRESALPPGSEVLFRAPSLWREHPWGVLGTIVFILGETGLVLGLVLERRRRRRTREQEQLLSAIVESSNDAIIGVSPDRRIVSWNRAAQNMFGYAPEEVVGQRADLLVPPDRLQEATSAFESTMAGRTVAPFETVRLRKDGTPVSVSINDSPIRDSRGKIIGISSTQRDITEHKRMEVSVWASEEKFRQFFSGVPDYCYIVSPQGEILDINSAALAVLGYEREEIIGKSLAAIYAPESQARMKELFAQWQHTGLIVDEEIVIVSKSSERSVVILNVGAERDQDGKIVRSTSVQTDITERKRAELERQRLQQELSHVARVTMMGELTSSLAHELNQPLTAILSNAQTAQRMLAAGIPDLEELREIMNDIVADDERAGGIIGRLRALLKKGQLELQPVDLNSLVIEVAGLVRSDTIIKNVPLTLDLTPDLPPIRGDRVQLQQVVLNLMMNAIDAMKGTAGIDRRLVVRTESGEGVVRVAVRDSGTGIPADQLEQIFEAFYTTKAEGMGMGLAIARSIVRSHGGRLWAENNPAGGATFTLALPTVQ